MSFYDEYELLDLVRDDGVKTFRARQLSTSRLVEVHVFSNAVAPISRALLGKVDRIIKNAPPGQPEPSIVSRGEYEGTPYFVTVPLEGFSSLHEWVSSIAQRPSTAAPAPPAVPEPDRLRLSGAGAWNITAESRVPEPPPATPSGQWLAETLPGYGRQQPPLAPTLQGPEPSLAPTLQAPEPQRPMKEIAPQSPAPLPRGENTEERFNRLFVAPAPQPPAPQQPPSGIKEPSGIKGGEFTRMIQTMNKSSVPAPASALPADPNKPTDPNKPADPNKKDPGEFTRMLQMPAQPPKTETAPAPPADQEQVGEFTQMLRRTTQRPEPPRAAPSYAPPADQTTLLRPPVTPQPPPTQPPDVHETTRTLEFPRPNPTAPLPDPVSAPPAPAMPPGAFTRAIQTAMSATPQSGSPAAQPPGEFTRMIQSTPKAPPSQPSWNTPPSGLPPSGALPYGVPEQAGALDLNRYSESPAGPMPQGPEAQRIQPLNPGVSGTPVGEYTQLFGSARTPPMQSPPVAGPTSGSEGPGGATNAFNVPAAPAYPQYPPAPAAYPGYGYYDPAAYPAPAPAAPQGPGEFTRKFAAPAPPMSLGQQAPNPQQPPAAPPNPYAAPPNPYGAPPAAPPPYGMPQAAAPSPYGAPPPQYGAPQPPYGAPAPYGQPPAPYGQPPAPYGAAPPQYGAPPAYGQQPGMLPPAAPPQNIMIPGGGAPAAGLGKTGGASKLPLIIGGAGLLMAVILLILFFVTRK